MEPDLSRFRRLPLIDCHVHHSVASLVPDVVSLMESIGIDAINVVSTPHPEHLSLNPQALEFKARFPQRVYAFGCLDYSEPLAHGRFDSHLAGQIPVLQQIGCDGLKMIEGKPLVRKLLPLPPFDGPEYEPVFGEMEARGFPLLFHVADPEEFWLRDLAPAWAVARGWFYGDDPVFPSKEEMYREVASVLDRHPALKVIFAHFYFLSADLPRAADLLDTYPQVHLDICPGSEIYVNFSARPDATREFFLKYQDRLIYGSDMSASTLFSEPGLDREREMARQWTMHMFLETEGPFEAPPTFAQAQHPLVGIGLPEDALRKVYQGNFQRVVGKRPAPLNVPAATEECQRLASTVEGMGKNPDEIRRIVQVLSANVS